ncbi:MAG: PilZ domain-containing protein [Nitrospirota bacterium]
MRKRRQRRFTKRLEAKFSSGGMSFVGMSSNMSEDGLFIRTRNSFIPETVIDIELFMPDGKKSFLRGKVKRSIRKQIPISKNGMGVELIEKDAAYINFLASLTGENF